MINRKNEIKITANILGYLGVIPFIILPITIYYFYEKFKFLDLRLLHLVYSIIIINFLGGLHWGRIASEDNKHKVHDKFWLMISVIPSIASCFLLFVDMKISYIIIISLYFLFCFFDVYLVKRKIWSNWMKILRINLSFCAISSLTILLFI